MFAIVCEVVTKDAQDENPDVNPVAGFWCGDETCEANSPWLTWTLEVLDGCRDKRPDSKHHVLFAENVDNDIGNWWFSDDKTGSEKYDANCRTCLEEVEEHLRDCFTTGRAVHFKDILNG